MIQPMSGLLRIAEAGGYAVGAFNFYNYEILRATLDVAEEEGLPVIAAFGDRYLENMDPEEASALFRARAQKLAVPAALHLDHCSNVATIRRAIEAGFTSVMYDGSSKPFEENLANTIEVVKLAHAAGVSVEAELGTLRAGVRSEEAGKAEAYTDPAEAERFARESGADALAVSIGTVHGLYKGTPKIDLGVLAAIKARVNIPLVLHGGSGTPPETIRACIAGGVRKINVNTEISVRVIEGSAGLIAAEKSLLYSKLSKQQQLWAAEVVRKYMRLFAGR